MTSYNHSITTCKKRSDITLYFFLLRGKAKIKMKKCPAASTRLCVIIDWDYNVTIFCHWSSEPGVVFLDQVVQGPYPPRSFGQNPKEQQLFYRETFPYGTRKCDDLLAGEAYLALAASPPGNGDGRRMVARPTSSKDISLFSFILYFLMNGLSINLPYKLICSIFPVR